jgi:hypothetical protein
MIWLTWQQHRKQALFAVVGLAMLAALLLPTGLQMHHAATNTGLATCRAQESRPEFVEAGGGPKNPATAAAAEQDCGEKANRFNSRFGTYVPLLALFLFLPLLLGLFFGAPLIAREIEHGTHRLVWTQGVTRRRWTLVKTTVVGASALAVAAAYTTLVSWWSAPLKLADRNEGAFSVPIFDARGLAPLGYTIFAMALGIFAGTVWRKTLPAMAATLLGFLAVRVAVTALARPRLLPARQRQAPLGNLEPNGALRGDWVLAGGVYDPNQHQFVRDNYLVCPPDMAASLSPGPCGYPVGTVNLEIYQPREHYWLFQTLETGIFIALAAILIVLAMRQIRRRIT